MLKARTIDPSVERLTSLASNYAIFAVFGICRVLSTLIQTRLHNCLYFFPFIYTGIDYPVLHWTRSKQAQAGAGYSHLWQVKKNLYFVGDCPFKTVQRQCSCDKHEVYFTHLSYNKKNNYMKNIFIRNFVSVGNLFL
jgi:hypothetical protein